MGYGLFYKYLTDMEGVNAVITFSNKKKTLTGRILSVNLEKGDGLYIMVELGNGERKLLTPENHVRDVTFKPQVSDGSLESLSEGV